MYSFLASVRVGCILRPSPSGSWRGLGGQFGASIPNCLAYSAFSRCQPPNFIASPADKAADRVAAEKVIQDVEADVPPGRTHRDEAAVDVVPQRQPRAATNRFELPPEIVAAPVYSSSLGASARFTGVSVTCGVGAPTVVSFTGCRRRPDSDPRQRAPIRAAAPDPSAPATPSPARGAAPGRERASTSLRPFVPRAPLAGPGVYCARSIIVFSLSSFWLALACPCGRGGARAHRREWTRTGEMARARRRAPAAAQVSAVEATLGVDVDSTKPASRSTRRCFDTVGCDMRSSTLDLSATDCSEETSRLKIARRFGSAMMSKTDSTLSIYRSRYMPVNAYVGLALSPRLEVRHSLGVSTPE